MNIHGWIYRFHTKWIEWLWIDPRSNPIQPFATLLGADESLVVKLIRYDCDCDCSQRRARSSTTSLTSNFQSTCFSHIRTDLEACPLISGNRMLYCRQLFRREASHENPRSPHWSGPCMEATDVENMDVLICMAAGAAGGSSLGLTALSIRSLILRSGVNASAGISWLNTYGSVNQVERSTILFPLISSLLYPCTYSFPSIYIIMSLYLKMRIEVSIPLVSYVRTWEFYIFLNFTYFSLLLSRPPPPPEHWYALFASFACVGGSRLLQYRSWQSEQWSSE